MEIIPLDQLENLEKNQNVVFVDKQKLQYEVVEIIFFHKNALQIVTATNNEMKPKHDYL